VYNPTFVDFLVVWFGLVELWLSCGFDNFKFDLDLDSDLDLKFDLVINFYLDLNFELEFKF
jgi:hypothetical protein